MVNIVKKLKIWSALATKAANKNAVNVVASDGVIVESPINGNSVDHPVSPDEGSEDLENEQFDTLGARTDHALSDPLFPFAVEKTDLSPEPTVFCVFPDIFSLCCGASGWYNDVSMDSNPNHITADQRYSQKLDVTLGTTESAVTPSGDNIKSSTERQQESFKQPALTPSSSAGKSLPVLSAEEISQLPADQKHTYVTHADARRFRLRCGPNYKRNGLKAPSAAAFMELVGFE